MKQLARPLSTHVPRRSRSLDAQRSSGAHAGLMAILFALAGCAGPPSSEEEGQVQSAQSNVPQLQRLPIRVGHIQTVLL